MFDLYIAIANIAFFFALRVGVPAAQRARRAAPPRARPTPTAAACSSTSARMEMVYWLLDPIIDFLAALRITPNMVTLFSLLPAAGAGVALGFGWFGLASRAGGDGDVLRHPRRPAGAQDRRRRRTRARCSTPPSIATARSSASAGLVYYYRAHDQVLFIVLAAIVGSFMVSYATAKAEAMGVAAPRGAMRRGERAAYLIFGAAFTPLAKALFANSASLALHELPDHPGAQHRRRGLEHLGRAAARRDHRGCCARRRRRRRSRPRRTSRSRWAASRTRPPARSSRLRCRESPPEASPRRARAVAVLGVDPPPHDGGDLDDRRLQRAGRDGRARRTSAPSPRRRSRRSPARSPTSR